MVLTAWGLAGIVGPTLYDVVMDKTGSLNATLVIFSGLFLIALIMSIVMKISIMKSQKTIKLKVSTN
jgi:OFA family oxalate/formate antiporter-like MFS transporter